MPIGFPPTGTPAATDAWIVLLAWVGVLATTSVLYRLRSIVWEAVGPVVLWHCRRTARADRVGTAVEGWLRRVPGMAADAPGLVHPSHHGQGVRQVVCSAVGLLWGIYVGSWASDRTLQLGVGLCGVGVGTVVIGLQAAGLHQPWAPAETMLGVAVAVVGYYLAAIYNHVGPDVRVHRVVLACALAAVAGCALVTAARFQPAGPESATGIARLAMSVGGALGAFAAMMTCVAITAGRLSIASSAGRSSGAVLATTRTCGAACIVYATAHVVLAATLAPTTLMRASLVCTVACLCLAARVSFDSPSRYGRLLDSMAR